MADGRANEQITDVVRAHRVEIVDERGRLRATLDSGTDSEVVGLRIFDRHGSERITLAVSSWGAFLDLATGGNTSVHIECRDDIEESAEPGASLVLCDRQGSPVLEWSVTLDGGLIEQRPQADGGDSHRQPAVVLRQAWQLESSASQWEIRQSLFVDP